MRIRSSLLFTSALSLAVFGCSSSGSTGDSGGTGGIAGATGGASGAHQGGAGAGGKMGAAAGSAGTGNGGTTGIAGGASGAGGEAGALTGSGEAGEAGAGGSEVATKPIQNTKRVLLISVDGLHQIDLAKWIAGHATSTLAKLAATGVEYTAAHTPTPSDSFPGILALVTGGTPKTTGVYYDDSYDRTLYAPGSKCVGNPGTEIVFDESLEYDDSKIFSGGIDTANLPYEKDARGNCKVVYPHDFVKVNTLFEVIRAAGGYTRGPTNTPHTTW